jgi:S1-C subfamily serine protease
MTTRTLTAVTAVAALALAGCGARDDGHGAGTSAARTQTVQTTTRVEVLKEARLPGANQARPPGFDPAGIYARESPGVVTVISTGLQAGGRDESGLGSGFVISGDGEVATNAHVVTSGEGNQIREAREVFVRFQDGNQVPAKVVGFDPFSDVALLKVDPAGLTLRPLPLGSAKDLVVGSPVAAIGSPFGEEQSLSVGVISALDRSIQSLTGFDTTGAIQTDAAINHGNSGGPLLDNRGRVLGINSQIQTSSGDGTGVGFAVPVDTVKRSLDQLRRDGRAHYAYLGVATAAVYPQLAERFGLPVRHGAWVQEVTPGGPSADAGIRAGSGDERFQGRGYATGGDVVTAVAGRPVRKESDLAESVNAFRPGDEVTLTVVRGSDRRAVKVRLGERPLDAPQR